MMKPFKKIAFSITLAGLGIFLVIPVVGIHAQTATPASCSKLPGQTFSSAANGGAGGCVPLPAVTPGSCTGGLTFSSAANGGLGGCVPLPGSPADCASRGQTFSSGANNGAGGCDALPQVQSVGNLTYTPLEPLPFLSGYENGKVPLGQLANGLFKILIILGGVIATGAFVYAGIEYMVSEALPIKKAAVTRLNSALLGLFLLIVSWLILSTINPQLTVFSNVLNPTPDLILANPTQQTSSDPVVVSNGGVQTLTSPTTDAAIKAAQNSTDPTVQAAAADAVKKLDATCASTYRGDIAPAGNPCTQGSSQQFLGTKVYTACATITTVTGTQSCFYNP